MKNTDAESRFQRAFGELSDMPFPSNSEIDAVADLHAELADYDGFVAGLLLSDTPKSKLPKPDIELLARMESALGRFPASNEIRLYITYMKKIAEVLELAQMTTAVYPAKPLWARTLDRLKFR